MCRLFFLPYILFIVSFFTVHCAFGQQLFDLECKNIGNGEGLPPAGITAFAEDDNNFIWLGTDMNGLYRFDGYNCIEMGFCTENQQQEDRLKFGVMSLYLDSEGTLWIGTGGKGIFYKTKGEFCLKRLPLPTAHHPLEYAHIRDIIGDAAGRIWFASNSDGLFYYDLKTQVLTEPFREKMGKNFVGLGYDAIGKTIWVLDGVQMVYALKEYDLNSFKTYQLPYIRRTEESTNLEVDAQGNVWAYCYQKGLFLLRKGAEAFEAYQQPSFQNRRIISFSAGPNGNFFACLDDYNFYVLYPEENRYELYDNLSLKIWPNNIFSSRNADTWIAGFPFGLRLYYNNDYANYLYTPQKCANGVASNNTFFPILNIHPLAKDSSLLIGTDGMGVYQFFPNTQTFVPFRLGTQKRDYIKTIFTDHKGRIWFGHWIDGMTCYNPQSGSFQYYNRKTPGPYQLTGDHVWAFAEDQSDNLWVSCLGDGLIKFSKDGSERQTYFLPVPGERPKKILDILCDAFGTVWVAFEEHGVAFLKKNATDFEFIDAIASGLSSNNTLCLFEDSKRNIWVGTQANGINLWQNGKFITFSKKDGLMADDAQSILEDDAENILVHSGKGTSILKLQNNTIREVSWIKSKEENQLRHLATFRDTRGRIYIGGTNGLNMIQKNANFKHAASPQVLISAIRDSFNTYAPVRTDLLAAAQNYNIIRLDWGQRNVAIEFASSIFSDPKHIEYMYLLENYSNSWTTLENGERKATFINLESGTYRLRVKCRTNHLGWGEEKIITLKVSLPVWESKWFIVTLTLAFLSVLIALGLFRYRNLESQIKEKALMLEKRQLEMEKIELVEAVLDKDQELMAKSVEAAQKNEKLLEIKKLLDVQGKGSEQEKNSSLFKLRREIESELKSEEEWESFRIHFDKTNQDFSEKLSHIFPNLTSTDIRMSILIRLRLDTKDIAQMLNISTMGVHKSRYRLKKRMGLGPDEDLNAYLQSLFYTTHEPVRSLEEASVAG